MNIIKKSTELTKSPIFAILSCLLCILAGYSIKSSLIEIFASVMGIINVWLLSKEKISNFIFGIITVLAYLYIYYTTGLYALAILACFQVIFNIYGWYYWGKGDDGNSTKTYRGSFSGLRSSYFCGLYGVMWKSISCMLRMPSWTV